MIQYIEYIGLPATVGIGLVGIFLIVQLIGEILELKGKVVPEFLKVRKYFHRKKTERETLQLLPDTLSRVEKSLADMNAHYNTDNIRMRDEWIKRVNDMMSQNAENIQALDNKLTRINQDTLSLLIEGKRNSIISFASMVIDENRPVTREQFNRVFKIYNEYEEIIKERGIENGEVDIAIRIIREAYENHMRAHSFIEDVRGYAVRE